MCLFFLHVCTSLNSKGTYIHICMLYTFLHTCMHTLLHRPTVRGIRLTGFDELFKKLCQTWTSGRLAVTDTLTSRCAVSKDGLSSREQSNTTRSCCRWYAPYDLPHWAPNAHAEASRTHQYVRHYSLQGRAVHSW